ncbi:MAG: 4Fe-4S dicluster domain-containing protein [bacterium]|nr:4Fe-4S dicluster domain-containing protein [bacterium]
MTSVGASIITIPLLKYISPKISIKLIRPPGALPETDFLKTCIRCAKCMKICPTKGLQPTLMEAGINGMLTPMLVSRIGGCEKDCTGCGKICPTSAIRNLSQEEKTYAKIGTAVIDEKRCIAWAEQKTCLICDEACPYNAIDSVARTIDNISLLRPTVRKDICMGCGICESRCPVKGDSAIQIFSIGEERRKYGSYITKEKSLLKKPENTFENSPENIPSGFITQ